MTDDDWKMKMAMGTGALSEEELKELPRRQAHLLRNAYALPDYDIMRNVPVFGDVPVIKREPINRKWWQFWRRRTAPP